MTKNLKIFFQLSQVKIVAVEKNKKIKDLKGHQEVNLFMYFQNQKNLNLSILLRIERIFQETVRERERERDRIWSFLLGSYVVDVNDLRKSAWERRSDIIIFTHIQTFRERKEWTFQFPLPFSLTHTTHWIDNHYCCSLPQVGFSLDFSAKSWHATSHLFERVVNRVIYLLIVD